MRPKAAPDGIVHYKIKPQFNWVPTAQDKIRESRLRDCEGKRRLATEPQIQFALWLLEAHEYSIDQTDESFEEFDLALSIGISVEVWLASLSQREIRTIISDLKYRKIDWQSQSIQDDLFS